MKWNDWLKLLIFSSKCQRSSSKYILVLLKVTLSEIQPHLYERGHKEHTVHILCERVVLYICKHPFYFSFLVEKVSSFCKSAQFVLSNNAMYIAYCLTLNQGSQSESASQLILYKDFPTPLHCVLEDSSQVSQNVELAEQDSKSHSSIQFWCN